VYVGFCNVWVFSVGVYMCRFCNVCVCMRRFFNVCLWVCVRVAMVICRFCVCGIL